MRARFTTSIHSAPSAFARRYAPIFALREAVKCDPAQIMVVSGSQQALDITARVLLDPGDSVLIEEPGYGLERTLLAASGCRLKLVPVDDEGMDVTHGIRMYPDAKAAFVTPSHHYPLGSTMSATRRLLLLNWAQSLRRMDHRR